MSHTSSPSTTPIQRMIPRTDVIIPFAAEIEAKYPAHRVDARRAFLHHLQTVKAVALLHFMQRDRDEDGNIIATRDDYCVAVDLAEVPLAVAMGGLSAGALAFYGRLTAKIPQDQGFSVTEAIDATGAPKSSAHRYLAELASAGLVDVTRGGSGRADMWRRTHRTLPATITLPTIGNNGRANPHQDAVTSPAATPLRRGPTCPPPWA